MTTADGGAVPAPPAPIIDANTEQFWAAAAEGRLVLGRSRSGTLQLPIFEVGIDDGEPIEHVEVSGDGVIYSYIVVHHPAVPAFAADVPYVLVLVELAGGCRLPGRLVDAANVDRSRLIGSAVRAGFDRYPNAAAPALVFRLTEPDELPDRPPH